MPQGLMPSAPAKDRAKTQNLTTDAKSLAVRVSDCYRKMGDVVRLVCTEKKSRKKVKDIKTFDVPSTEAQNLKLRLEKAGWEVIVKPL